MLRKLASCAVLLPLAMTAGGCLFEATLDAKGGGTMTATVGVDKAEFPTTKKKMESSAVKLTSAELVTTGAKSTGVFKLAFSDVSKLATTQYFRAVRVTRVAGSKEGTTELTAKVKNANPLNLPEEIAARFGTEVKVVVAFPGPVSESNGTISGGNTVTWTWPLKDFFNIPEVVMTATYNAGTAPAEPGSAGKPTAGATPAASGGKAKPGS